MILEQRVKNAGVVREQLPDRLVEMTTLTEGYQSECLSDHGPLGWVGPINLEVDLDSRQYPAWFNAMLDSWQHDMTEHARYLVEPTWDEIIAGPGRTLPPRPPLISFRRQRPVLQFWVDFWEALKGLFSW